MPDFSNISYKVALAENKKVVVPKKGSGKKVFTSKDKVKLEIFPIDNSWNLLDKKDKVIASFPYAELKDKNQRKYLRERNPSPTLSKIRGNNSLGINLPHPRLG